MEYIALGINSFRDMIAFVLILILPGFSVISLISLKIKKFNFDLIEQLILSIGLSMSIVPIIVLLYTTIGIRLTQITAILTVITFLILLTCMMFIKYKNTPLFRQNSISKEYLSYFLLLVLFMASMCVRLIPIQSFIVPPGHDPQFHSIISQLIIEQEGIPRSYEPYAPLNSFSYPFGLHSIVVFFHFLTNEGIARLVLILSTVFNAMILLPVYLLVKKISNSNSNAMFSALLVGLVGRFPAGIIIHGKNAHITALVVLPIAILLLYYVFKTNKNIYMLLASVSSAGLLLIHYRVFGFYLLFWASLLLCQLIHVLKKQERARSSLIKIFLTPMIGLIIVLPWLQNIFHRMYSIPSDLLAPQQAELISTISFSSFIKIINPILNTNGLCLCIFAILGLGIVLVRKKEEMYPFILWLFALLLFLTTIPLSLHIPGSNFINAGSIRITLFLPLSILAGYVINPFVDSDQKDINIGTHRTTLHLRVFAIIICFLIVCIALFSAIQVYSKYSISKNNVLVSGQDLEAMEWINKNTPPNSIFWSHAYYWRGPNVILGSDAGYWIPILAHRPNAIPIIPYFGEDHPSDYFKKCEKLIELTSIRPSEKETLCLLKNLNISYIYIGKRIFGGPVIDKQLLAEIPSYELVYQKDSVSIFKINYTCTQYVNIIYFSDFVELNPIPINVFSMKTTFWNINGISKRVLFEHPSSNGKSYIWYKNIEPYKNSLLKFSIAMHPEVWKQNMGDGVLFEIYVDQDLIFSKYIDPKNNISDRKWHDYCLDISKYVGKKAKIGFVTSPGPNNSTIYDWAGWGNPIIIE